VPVELKVATIFCPTIALFPIPVTTTLPLASAIRKTQAAKAASIQSDSDTSSFLISLGDEAASHSGALLKMLMPMAERGVNLSKIESRPSKKRPWDYYFFIDVTGHFDDPSMKEALADLKKFCPLVKWLGSYPAVN